MRIVGNVLHFSGIYPFGFETKKGSDTLSQVMIG